MLKIDKIPQLRSKGISSAAAAVIIATISITLVGTTYFFSTSVMRGATAETFEVVDIFQNRIIVRNTGTEVIEKFKCLIDGNSIKCSIKNDKIEPGKVGTLILEEIEPGSHELTLITKSMSQTWRWKFEYLETTMTTTSTSTTTTSTLTTTPTIRTTIPVAINNIIPSPDVTYPHVNHSVNITITARNKGNMSEVFDVSAFYRNETLSPEWILIGTKSGINLDPGLETTFSITWSTVGVESCYDYSIKANITIVPGETEDNEFIDGMVHVKIMGDINSDGIVDDTDLNIVKNAFGSEPGDENWDPDADLNKDDIVDIVDEVIVALNYESSCEKITASAQTREASIEANVETEQGTAEVGKPVKWTSRISFNNPSPVDIQNYLISFIIPEDASNVEIKDEEARTMSKEASMTLSIASKETKNYVLEYETPAPYKEESITEPFVPGMSYRKAITIKSNFIGHYKNVKAYTDIPEELSRRNYRIRLYQTKGKSRVDVTDFPQYNFSLIDTDGNDLADKVEWIVPKLSVTTFDLGADPTETVRPNGDYSVAWSVSPSGNHYTTVDDAVNQPDAGDTTDYIYTSSKDAIDEFEMETLTAVESVSEVKVWVYAYGDGGDYIDVNIYMGSYQTAQRITPGTSYGWGSANFTGSWTQSDLDSLRIQLKYGSSGKANNLYVATVYADVSYFVADAENPRWLVDAGSNATNKEEYPERAVNFSSQWTDNLQLDKYIFSWNASGSCDTWSNSSWTDFLTGNWTNTTKQFPTTCEGKTVGFKFYARDTAGNENATNIDTVKVLSVTRWLETEWVSGSEVNSTCTESNPCQLEENTTFNANATVTCKSNPSGFSCGSVSGGIRHNTTGDVKTLINTSEDTPFYIVGGGEAKNNWTNLNPTATPMSITKRNKPGMAYDSKHDRIVLFGGFNSTGASEAERVLNDTWVYNYSDNTWYNVTNGKQPSARHKHRMVYHSGLDVFVLFGGNDGITRFNDTWLYNYTNNSWKEITPSSSPSKRDFFGMVYDSYNDVVILFGGTEGGTNDENFFNDTWILNYTDGSWNWYEVTPTGSPPKREELDMVYDSDTKRTIMFGGFYLPTPSKNYNDTWELNYTPGIGWKWYEINASTDSSILTERRNHMMAYDSESKLTILFGGYDPDIIVTLNETWLFNYTDKKWYNTNIPLDQRPPIREFGGMVYDSKHDLAILFGGDDLGFIYYNDTWMYEYTLGGANNPESCGVLSQGQSCQLNWTVNTTGNTGEVYKIDVNFTSDLDLENKTDDAIVRIGPVIEDTEPPEYFDNSTNSTLAGKPVEFRLRWTDNVGLSDYVFSLDNCTKEFNNITDPIESTQWSGSPKEAWSNVTVVINDTVGCEIRWKVYAYDTSGNWNVSETFSFVTTDTTPPQWSNNQSDIVSTYSPTTKSYFNITWIDSVAVDNVFIEGNWSGSAKNYTMFRYAGTDVYGYNLTLPAGNFYWRSYANDTSGNEGSSDQWNFTVDKADNPVTLYFRNSTGEYTNQNMTVTYGIQTNTTGTATAGTVYLYRNESEKASGSSPQSDIEILGVGVYTYKVNATGNANYSDNSTGITRTLTVNKGTLSLSITPPQTVTYPTETTITGTEENEGDADVIYQLWRDDNKIKEDPPYSETIILGYGTYTYRFNATGGANWTANATGVTTTVTVNKGAVNIDMWLNDAFNTDNAITYPAQANTTCVIDITSQNAFNLYRNGTLEGSQIGQKIEYVELLPAGVFNFTCHYNETQNYSSFTRTNYLTVNKAPTETKLYLNDTPGNKDYNKTDIANITATTNVSFLNVSIYANYTDGLELIASDTGNVTNFTDTSNLALGPYLIKANTTGNENYTSSEVEYILTVVSGWLNVTLLTPDPIACNGTNPCEWFQNFAHRINAFVECEDGPCGYVEGVARYNDTPISTTEDTPFYIVTEPEPLYLNVSSNDTARTGWLKVGSDPYIDAEDYPTNYINTTEPYQAIGDFYFDNATVTGTIEKVELQIWATSALVLNFLEPHIWNGTWNTLSEQAFLGWGWKKWDVTSILDTWEKINSTKMYLNFSSGFSSYPITVDYARLNVMYTPKQNPKSCGPMFPEYKCQLNWTVNVTGPLGEIYEIDVNFTSSYDIWNDTDSAFVNIVPDKLPQYFDNSTNQTTAGEPTEFRVRWTDDYGLSGYIFSLDNGTGTFKDDPWVAFNDADCTNSSYLECWSNVTKVVSETVDVDIRWKVTVNDTRNQQNISSNSFVTGPPWLDVTLLTPTETLNQTLNSSFYLNARVTCIGPGCEEVKGLARYNESPGEPYKPIPKVRDDEPFYLFLPEWSGILKQAERDFQNISTNISGKVNKNDFIDWLNNSNNKTMGNIGNTAGSQDIDYTLNLSPDVVAINLSFALATYKVAWNWFQAQYRLSIYNYSDESWNLVGTKQEKFAGDYSCNVTNFYVPITPDLRNGTIVKIKLKMEEEDLASGSYKETTNATFDCDGEEVNIPGTFTNVFVWARLWEYPYPQNPKSCPGILDRHESCETEWQVNVIGDPGTSWLLDVNFNSTRSDTNENDTENALVNIIEMNPPQWSDNKTFPESPAIYSPGRSYQFNITWIDDTRIDDVIFEWEGKNVSSYKWGNVSNSSDEYYVDLEDLSAGTYRYRWYANDTFDNGNSTPLLTYVVNKAPTSTDLLLNGTSSLEVKTTDVINSTVILNVSNKQVCLDTNITDWSIPCGLTPFENLTRIYTPGTYNFTGYFSGDQNYSASSNTSYVTVINRPPMIWNLVVRHSDGEPIPNNETNPGVLLMITVNASDPDNNIGYVEGNFTDVNDGVVNITNFTYSPTDNYTHVWNYTPRPDAGPGQAYINVMVYDTGGLYNKTTTNITILVTAVMGLNNTPINFSIHPPGKEVEAIDKQGWPLNVKVGGNVPLKISQNGSEYLTGIEYSWIIIYIKNITWNQSYSGNFSSLTTDPVLVNESVSPGESQPIYYKLYVPTVEPQKYGGKVLIKGEETQP